MMKAMVMMMVDDDPHFVLYKVVLHNQHKISHEVIAHPRVRQSLFEGHVLKPNGSGQHPRARNNHAHLMTMWVQGWQDRPDGNSKQFQCRTTTPGDNKSLPRWLHQR